MAGKRQISKNDSHEIHRYLKKKLADEIDFPSEADNTMQVIKTCELANSDFDEINPLDNKALLDWCYIYLSKKQWQRLKTAVRRRRQREKKRNSVEGSDIGVELSCNAHRCLAQLAQHHGKSLSEFILDRHWEEYLEIL